MEMATYSQPINRAARRNNLLQRILKAAFDRFIAADEDTEASRKAREQDPEYHEAIITIFSDILRTKL